MVTVLISVSCTDPAPTELTNPEESSGDNFDLELLSPEPEQFVYSNGYDSTGIINPVPNFTSIISISHVKNTLNNLSRYKTIGLAIFFDRSNRVVTPNGRVVGFGSRILGRVSFNQDTAAVVPYRIKILDRGERRDTLLGFQHLLYRDSFLNLGNTFLPYGSSVKAVLNRAQGNKNFNIPVPNEITGTISVSGNPLQPNFTYNVKWNSEKSKSIEIILGGVPTGVPDIFPLLRMRTPDDGSFNIPKYILDRIDFKRFDYIVVTLIRKNKIEKTDNSLGEVYIAAQSIHNIFIKTHQ